jgi:phage terminase small subunit
VANPAHRLARAARNDYVALARDFGLTAASVARLPLEDDGDEEKKNPLGEFA